MGRVELVAGEGDDRRGLPLDGAPLTPAMPLLESLRVLLARILKCPPVQQQSCSGCRG